MRVYEIEYTNKNMDYCDVVLIKAKDLKTAKRFLKSITKTLIKDMHLITDYHESNTFIQNRMIMCA